jgi:hypothetical protein
MIGIHIELSKGFQIEMLGWFGNHDGFASIHVELSD